MKLIEYTSMLRSKNAGPLWLTIDLGFADAETFTKVFNSGVLQADTIARLYETNAQQVRIIPYPVVNAIKITLPRRCPSGSIQDSDIYGCQQHMPLAELEVAL